MESSNLVRYAPLSGVLAFAFALLGFIVMGETPSIDDSTREVVDFVREHDNDYQLSALLAALAAASLVWFGGSLRTALRSAEGDPGRLSNLAYAGVLIFAIGITLFAGIEFTIGDGADELPATSLQTLTALDSDMFFTIAVGVVVMQLSTALTVLRNGGLPRWLGWASLGIAIVGLTPIGWIAFLATFIWVPLVGVVLYLAQGPAPRPTTGAGAGPPAP